MKEILGIIKADGWLYFTIGVLPGISTFLLSDQILTGRTAAGVAIAAVFNGAVALKAFRSKSKETSPEK